MVDSDKTYILFSSVVMAIAAKKHKAGTSHEEAEAFVKCLFDEYMSQGHEVPTVDWIVAAPKKTISWITTKLAGSFRCYGAPPKWLDEPSWRFIDNVPMDFVHQFEVSNTLNDDSYQGLITYVFFGRKKLKDGSWEMIVKLIQQDKNEFGTIFIY
ncbi:hypothetical protein [Pseudomonas putida]|uniref:hypothetical protein n=1 Tax=Pseudomonas putida TaxID=303 RepID=UPI0039066585